MQHFKSLQKQNCLSIEARSPANRIDTLVLLLWPWPWPWAYDLDIFTWPRYSEEVPAYQIWTF